MRKWMMLCLGLLFAAGVTAQQPQGVQFREEPFAKVLKSAKKAKKPVFIDIYTTWCGPCKFLSNYIFPKKIVGDYMNENFICAQFDAEQGEGVAIARRYAVERFPTMLILDGKGKELGRLVGISPKPGQFVQRLQAEMERIRSAR